jgi:hypothetical protein
MENQKSKNSQNVFSFQNNYQGSTLYPSLEEREGNGRTGKGWVAGKTEGHEGEGRKEQERKSGEEMGRLWHLLVEFLNMPI